LHLFFFQLIIFIGSSILFLFWCGWYKEQQQRHDNFQWWRECKAFCAGSLSGIGGAWGTTSVLGLQLVGVGQGSASATVFGWTVGKLVVDGTVKVWIVGTGAAGIPIGAGILIGTATYLTYLYVTKPAPAGWSFYFTKPPEKTFFQKYIKS